MRPKAAQHWLNRPWFAALLFAALLSRALIPLGFMPGPGGIVLCSGYAPVPTMPYGSAATHNMPGMDMPGMDMPGMDMSGNADHADAKAPSQRHEGVEICLFSAVARGRWPLGMHHRWRRSHFSILVLLFFRRKSPCLVAGS